MNNLPKIYFGPMSKNVIDYVSRYDCFGFIPSRRQVDYNGGYVDGLTAETLRSLVDNRVICRDHGGIGKN